jgi:hypothetical protein
MHDIEGASHVGRMSVWVEHLIADFEVAHCRPSAGCQDGRFNVKGFPGLPRDFYYDDAPAVRHAIGIEFEAVDQKPALPAEQPKMEHFFGKRNRAEAV